VSAKVLFLILLGEERGRSAPSGALARCPVSRNRGHICSIPLDIEAVVIGFGRVVQFKATSLSPIATVLQ